MDDNSLFDLFMPDTTIDLFDLDPWGKKTHSDEIRLLNMDKDELVDLYQDLKRDSKFEIERLQSENEELKRKYIELKDKYEPSKKSSRRTHGYETFKLWRTLYENGHSVNYIEEKGVCSSTTQYKYIKEYKNLVQKDKLFIWDFFTNSMESKLVSYRVERREIEISGQQFMMLKNEGKIGRGFTYLGETEFCRILGGMPFFSKMESRDFTGIAEALEFWKKSPSKINWNARDKIKISESRIYTIVEGNSNDMGAMLCFYDRADSLTYFDGDDDGDFISIERAFHINRDEINSKIVSTEAFTWHVVRNSDWGENDITPI